MAARRGKTQARRHSGNGLPGWAWALIGALIAVVLVLAVPRWLASEDADTGPQPNPDAQPAPVASGDGLAQPGDSEDGEQEEQPEYDFYTLLPGKEVELSDAELAAQERAEEQAREQAEAAEDADAPLPQPVDTDADADTATATDDGAPPPDPAGPATEDGSRYLLQAGAFQSAQQAEALKARIALLGLSARVEPATIDGKVIYRVRMGPYDSAGALADAKRKLANRGLPGMAIKVK